MLSPGPLCLTHYDFLGPLTPISQQFSLPIQGLVDNDGTMEGAAPDLFTLTLTDGTTVQLRVQEEQDTPGTMGNDTTFSSSLVDTLPLTTSLNQSSCPSGLAPMMPLDPTVEFPAYHHVVVNNFHPPTHEIMGSQREPVTIQDVDITSPISEKNDDVQVEDFDDILKNIMDSADNSCSSDQCNQSKDTSCSTKSYNTQSSSPNINKDVTLQLAAPIHMGDEDDDEDSTKLNSLQTTLSSMSSYLSHLKTGLKGYDLPEPPTDVHLSFDSLTGSNFPDLLNYNIVEKDSTASKHSTKRNTRGSSSSKASKYSTSKSNIGNARNKNIEYDENEDACEMDGIDHKADSESTDFIDDELLSMFTSVQNTTIESLKARLMASRLPDGSSETDLGALLVAAKIDLSVDDIVTPPLNSVKKLMDSHALTDWQQTLCLKIRRRKKNTVSTFYIIHKTVNYTTYNATTQSNFII